jgi:hypothetical protein
MIVEYRPWSGDPHESDAGAVHRAVYRVACDLASAERMALREPHATRLIAELGHDARSMAYFVMSTIAERDVCDLDSAIARARDDRRIGETPEMAYARELRAYAGLSE